MMSESIGSVLDYGLGRIKEIREKPLYFADDEYCLAVLKEVLGAYHWEVHEYLWGIGRKESEQEIRKRVREIVTYVLPVIDKKVNEFSKYLGGSEGFGLGKIPSGMREIALEWIEVRDGYYALSACRSLKHFFLFMEEDRNIVDSPIWSSAPDNLFAGYWHYSGRKILDGDVNFMCKQMPTGYGKTVSDGFESAFIYGYNLDSDIIKVFGNPSNVSAYFEFLTSLMLSERYAEVFPYFKQFGGKKNSMFVSCSAGAGEFKIEGSTKSRNLLVIGKDKKISGARARYLYLDDITQAEDANNVRKHMEDIKTFKDVWFKRNYDFRDFKVTISGTTYSEDDIISSTKKSFGGDRAKPSNFKFTKTATSNMIIKNGLSVFVSIPKLDFDTDKSTYPVKFPTEKAREERENDYVTFMAMEQQMPLPPEGTPFFWTKLRTYEFIPHLKGEPLVQATLDPARKGGNYVAMPIFEKLGSAHYLKDVLYELRPMKDVHPMIVEKVIYHRIKHLHIENNTDASLRTLLEKMLLEKGYTSCNITESFTTVRKTDKIYGAEATIRENLIFPTRGLYAESSDMGKAMRELTSYSHTRKNDYDDMTDAVSSYAEKFVIRELVPTIRIINRRTAQYVR